MTELLTEFEGTLEDLLQYEDQLRGKRIKVWTFPLEFGANELVENGRIWTLRELSDRPQAERERVSQAILDSIHRNQGNQL